MLGPGFIQLKSITKVLIPTYGYFCECKWMCNIHESDPTLCTHKRKVFFYCPICYAESFVWWAYQNLLLFLVGDLLDPNDNTSFQ